MVCLAFGYGAVRLLVANAAVLHLNRDVLYPESAGVQIALWCAHTGRIFPHFHSSPFTPAVYGPAFYLGLGLIERWFHLGFFHLLVLGRLISFGSFLAVGLLLFVLVRRLGFNYLSALTAAVAMWSGFDFTMWISSARPDLPALFCTALGLLLAAWDGSPRRGLILASGLACSSAWLLKQSFVAVPLAILLWLLMQKRRREAAVFFAACALPALLVLAWPLVHGEPVLRSLTLLRHSVMQPRIGWQMLYANLVNIPANSWLFAWGLIGWLAVLRGSEKQNPARLLAIYFPIAWILPVVPLMQAGAAINYLFEGWLAAALLLPDAFEALRSSWLRISAFSRSLALVLLLAFVCGFQLPQYWHVQYLFNPQGYGNLRPLRAYRIFSSDDYLTVHGRNPELLDPDLAHILELTGYWSSAPIVRQLNRHYYDYLFVAVLWGGSLPQYRGIPYYSPMVLEAINRNYVSDCISDGMTVWRPRGRLSPLSSAAVSRILGASCQKIALTVHPDGTLQWRK